MRRLGKSAPALSSESAELALGCLDRVACFETLRAYGGRVFHWREHVRRLGESCSAIGAAFPVEGLEEWVKRSLKESGYPDALLRLAVHGKGSGGSFVLIIRPFHSHPAERYRKGVAIQTATQRRWTLKAQDPQIKANQFVAGVLAAVENKNASAHELVFLGQEGSVTEGLISNLFLFAPSALGTKTLLTPSVTSGILKGVTRSVVIGLARRRGWPVAETCLTRHDFYSAEECFLTNTSSEILPVVSMDGREIGNGRPGPLTRILAEDFKKQIEHGH